MTEVLGAHGKNLVLGHVQEAGLGEAAGEASSPLTFVNKREGVCPCDV